VGRINMAVKRKRKHVDTDSTDPEVGGTKQNTNRASRQAPRYESGAVEPINDGE
jgi:hypothetical protein